MSWKHSVLAILRDWLAPLFIKLLFQRVLFMGPRISGRLCAHPNGCRRAFYIVMRPANVTSTTGLVNEPLSSIIHYTKWNPAHGTGLSGVFFHSAIPVAHMIVDLLDPS